MYTLGSEFEALYDPEKPARGAHRVLNQTVKLLGVAGTDCFDIDRMALSATVLAYSTSISPINSPAIVSIPQSVREHSRLWLTKNPHGVMNLALSL
jgi:hypothetical protein